MIKNCYFVIAFILIIWLHLIPASANNEEHKQSSMTPPIDVTEEKNNWHIKGNNVSVSIKKSDLRISIKTQNIFWRLLPASADDMILQLDTITHSISFMDADKVTFSKYYTGFSTGIKIELNQFKINNTFIDLIVQLFITLETEENELLFQIIPIEKQTVIKECQWPKAFVADLFDFTVVPFMQGMLLPKDWPKRVWLYDTHTFSRGLYMPWWGHQREESAVLVLLETPNDAKVTFNHPKNGPTFIAPNWLHSLGKFQYS